MNSLNQRLIAEDDNWCGFINFCNEKGFNPKDVESMNKYMKAIGVQK